MAKESKPSKQRESRKLHDYRTQHSPHFMDTKLKPYGSDFERGQVITFIYKGEERWVFITHPLWKGKMHGLDIRFLPRRMLLPLFDVKSSMTAEQFYKLYIDKPWIKKWDSYRTYDRGKLSNVKVVTYDTSREPDELDEPGMENEPVTPVVLDANILQTK